MAGPIVVGVDGSPAAEGALAFAVREAQRRGTSLRIVHAYLVPSAVEVGTVPVVVGTEEEAALERNHREVLDAAVARAHAVDPLLAVEGVLVDGPAAPTLLDAAEDADLVVLGDRGAGALAAWVLGSVSATVTHHAPCPVVVVPHHT